MFSHKYLNASILFVSTIFLIVIGYSAKSLLTNGNKTSALSNLLDFIKETNNISICSLSI